ncbi:T9SS type A sorting domain-containing protein [bacterium SCSIO 12741]|nr:T9SS type A sorting domain-containing protein [bacterium SCSIO 12741]
MKYFYGSLLLLAIFFMPSSVLSQTYYARGDGDWDETDKWSTSGVGGSSCSCTPTVGSTVIIDGYDIDIDAGTGNVSVANISLTNSRNTNAQLKIEGGVTLSVTSNFQMYTANNRNKHVDLVLEDDNTTMNVTGTFTMTRASGNTQNRNLTVDMSNNSDLTVTGLFTIYNQSSSSSQNKEEIELNDQATLTCNGGVSVRQDAGGDLLFDLNNSSSWVIDGDMDFDLNGGDHTDFNLSGTSRITVSQDVDFDVDGGDDIEFLLSEGSSFQVGDDITFDMDGGEDLQFLMSNNSGSDHFLVTDDFLVDHDGGQDIDLELTNSAEIDVNGDFTIDWDASDANDSDIDLNISDNALVDVDGSLDINLNETTRDYCDLLIDMDYNGAWYVGVNNGGLAESASIRIVDGDYFHLDLDRDSKFEVYGNLTFSQSGDGDMDLHLNDNDDGSAADGQLRVDGNMIISKDDGDELQLRARNHSDIDIAGDLTITVTGYDGTFQDAEINLDDDVTMDIDGNLSITHNVTNNNSLYLDLDDNASITVGVNDGALTKSASIFFTDGYGYYFDLDRDAAFTVYGNLTQTFAGDEYCHIHLNANDDGSTTDGQLKIDGNWSVTSTDGDQFNIRILNHSDIDVGRDLTFNNSGFDAGIWGDATLRVEDDATLDVDGSMSWTFNPGQEQNDLILDFDDNAVITIGNDNGALAESLTINMLDGYTFEFDLDRDSRLDVYGNFDFSFAAGTHANFDLNSNNNGSASDGQLRIDGNWALVKSDGYQFRLRAYNHSDIDIGGNFTYTGTNHKTGWWDDEFISLRDDATMDVDGLFNFTMTTLAQENSLRIDLEDNTVFSIGSQVTDNHVITLVNGYRMRYRLDDNSVWNVNGSLQSVLTNSNQPADIGLNRGSGSAARLNITGNLDIDNNKNSDEYYVRLDGSSSVLNVDGNIDLSSAATSNRIELELNSSSKIEIGGNFVRTGGFGELDCNGTSTVEYNGNSTQTFAQDAGSGTDDFEYFNVIINNSFGTAPQLTMEGLATIPTSATITFTDGILASTEANILVLNDNANASGADADSYVDGPIRKVGDELFIFPTGDGDIFAPIGVDPTSGTTTAFRCEYVNSAPSNSDVLGTGINNISQNEYWNVVRTNTTNSATVTLYWDATRSGEINNYSELMVSHYTGGQWIDAGNNSLTGNNAGGTVTSDAQSSFSPFTLGSSTTNNPLPVELVSFKAVPNPDEEVVELIWITASELNNDYFEVERTIDMKEFIEVITVPGQGTTNERTEYHERDLNPEKGISYYRLSQTDFDGKQTYFDLEKVLYDMESSKKVDIQVYPNPNNGQTLFVKVPDSQEEDINVLINNFLGVEVYSDFSIYHQGDFSLVSIEMTQKLAPGSYFVNVELKGEIHTYKLIVQ